MRQSITAIHIECVRRLYNDHDQHSVGISNFLQKQLRSRSWHAAIAKEIFLQILALTSEIRREKSLVPQSIRDWYDGTDDEEDTESEKEFDCEWD